MPTPNNPSFDDFYAESHMETGSLYEPIEVSPAPRQARRAAILTGNAPWWTVHPADRPIVERALSAQVAR